MSRPDRLVAVVGTATEVGKTWVTAALLERLGGTAVARKPVQSYGADDVGRTDAEVLARAAGEEAHAVCPAGRWYAMPMAPPMAADVLGRPRPMVADLLAELAWPDSSPAIGFVETIGGVRSPIADDADCRDMVALLAPEFVLLVADAGLGVIDAVRAASDALVGAAPIVFLNRFDDSSDLHRRNLQWLREHDRMDVETDLDALAARFRD